MPAVWIGIAASLALSVTLTCFVTKNLSSTLLLLKTESDQHVARLSLPHNSSVPVLCMWAADDEIMLIFQMCDTLCEIAYSFLRPWMICAYLVAIMYCVGSKIAPPILWINSYSGEFYTFVFNMSVFLYMTILLIWLVTLNLVMTVVFRAAIMGTPIMSTHLSALVRSTFTPVPITSGRVEFWDMETLGKGLSHSRAYEEEAALKRLAKWIDPTARKGDMGRREEWSSGISLENS